MSDEIKVEQIDVSSMQDMSGNIMNFVNHALNNDSSDIKNVESVLNLEKEVKTIKLVTFKNPTDRLSNMEECSMAEVGESLGMLGIKNEDGDDSDIYIVNTENESLEYFFSRHNPETGYIKIRPASDTQIKKMKRYLSEIMKINTDSPNKLVTTSYKSK